MKKSLGLLVCLFAIPALLGCSRKNSSESKPSEQPTSSEPAPAPSSSEKEQDPEEVLPDFKDAIEVTANTQYSEAQVLEAGKELKFKIHFGKGIGKDRFISLGVNGSHISSSDKVEVKWFNYKGEEINKEKLGYIWGENDGWMYMSALKSEATADESKISLINVKSVDTRLPVIADGGEATDLHDVVVNKFGEFFVSFEAEKGKNYAISMNTTGGSLKYYGYNPDCASFSFNDQYLTKYKYNYTPSKSGLHAVRLYADTAAVTLVAGSIVQINITK